jgi:2-aminoadipate transaminase
MDINVNHTSQTPIYLQIKNQIRDMILRRDIPDGFVMPSERALARQVSVHRNTVTKVYNELREDGLLDGSQGLHFRVTFEGREVHHKRSSKAISWESLIKDEFLDLETTFDTLFSKSYAPGNISFAGGITPTEAYCKEDLNRVLGEIISNNTDDVYEYTPYQGLYSLRKSLCSFLGDKGILAHPGELQILSETNQAFGYLIEMLIKPGDVVITEEPVSPDVYRELKLAGAKVMTVPLDQDGMDCRSLEPILGKYKPKFIYVNSSFQDPTGIQMSLERRMELLDLSHRYGVPIIEDDSSSELTFAGPRIPSLKALDHGNNVIYIYSFALTFAPGMGMAFVAAPKALIKSLRYLISIRLISLDSLSQRLLDSFLHQGIYCRNVRSIRSLYLEKRDLMCDALEEAKTFGVQYDVPMGGVYIWCKLPDTMDHKILLEKAGKKGVTFIPGSVFYPNGTRGEHYIRLNYSYPGREQIARGIPLLIAAMKESILEK